MHNRWEDQSPVGHAHPAAEFGALLGEEVNCPCRAEHFDNAHHKTDLHHRFPTAEMVRKDANRCVGEEHRNEAGDDHDWRIKRQHG
ncbi:Uncharacterised protein [Vibrio cholerae]|uniref:Uncharacterized protein n=1 Tax=Vibrio cholerae TaxID=666 RepID=A0A655YEP9_VIBCL|nr:Uncharacterised protein [Vibrio cholerae]CSA81724.1 Uncharacterised protein [Vibrio cholerae]CSA95301.1 Uncharacterised protein [Vibrio cholerae]CSB15333.1 Uncharacterised protein [Vibrio cholerae]CSB15480.1 Uncharacterised protein [Vibrio cholerae]